MTHSLHRVGSRENLKKDWVLLCMASKGINDQPDAIHRLRRFLELCLKNNCVALGDAKFGNKYHQGSVEAVLNNLVVRSIVTASFNNMDSIIAMLHDLKKEDLGLSVVVSGLVDETRECCSKTGLKMHTVEHSLGRFGKTEKLPPEHILEMTTMCGHGMGSANFIREAIEEVKYKRMTPKQAAEEMFKPCLCGIFNTTRAAELIVEAVRKGL
ncbi:MAG: hypothetical protein P4N59_21235 [Negativicutes bacterium]|nr:hypothetical protein [Negativicutes bacterium]